MKALGAAYVTLEELMERSDIVSLHVPVTDGTRGLIGRELLAKMKKSAILINTARGPVVDNAALAEALERESTCSTWSRPFPGIIRCSRRPTPS